MNYYLAIELTSGVGLIFYAGFIQVVSADGAGVGADGPGPHGDCIPLLHLEAFASGF